MTLLTQSLSNLFSAPRGAPRERNEVLLWKSEANSSRKNRNFLDRASSFEFGEEKIKSDFLSAAELCRIELYTDTSRLKMLITMEKERNSVFEGNELRNYLQGASFSDALSFPMVSPTFRQDLFLYSKKVVGTSKSSKRDL